MCKPTSKKTVETRSTTNNQSSEQQQQQQQKHEMRQRRGKYDKAPLSVEEQSKTVTTTTVIKKKKRESKALQKHKNDTPSGGMESLLPSLIGVGILICAVMAKMGFRGRATIAGIDLGTTNSVICVQAQSAELQIDCIVDPYSNSPVIPSVVSFLEPHERKVGPSSKVSSPLHPHPSHTVVGQAAKKRIDSHPHHTLYHAKRVLGRSADDPAIQQLANEVEFTITTTTNQSEDDDNNNDNNYSNQVYFHVPEAAVTPQNVGSYVVYHLKRITEEYLGHDNVKSAVICVPAKFNSIQRQQTVLAFQQAGLQVARIVEEPTAAALAYGLHRKEGVDYILVYDFGGGTLDISLLHVSDGFVDVMGSDGDDRLGGTDFDYAIAHYLLEQKGTIVQQMNDVLHILEEQSTVDLEDVLSAQCPTIETTPLCTVTSFHTLGEQLKIGLSEAYEPDHPDTTMKAECLALSQQASSIKSNDWTIEKFCNALEPIELQLKSSEFEMVAKPLLDRSLLPVTRLLKDLDLQSSDIDEIVMVGGTTRMPQIRQLVRTVFTQSQLNTHIDPDITVAYGAASVID